MGRQLQSGVLQAGWVEAQGAMEDLIGTLIQNAGALGSGVGGLREGLSRVEC